MRVYAKNVLFLVATYVIGKERILVEISRRCKRKIHVSGRKMAVLSALGFGENGVFTEDELESDVHVVGWNVLGETWPYFRPNFVKMKEIMSERGYSKVVGFVPTGWTYEVKRNKFAVRSKDSFEIHLVPYSEHSNYDELREFVKFLKPKRVIPTVGADVEKVDSKHAFSMRKHFAGLVNEMAIKQEFLMGFLRGSGLVDVEKDCPIVLQNIPDQEDEVIASTPNCCSDVELEDDIKSSFPQQVSASSSPQYIRLLYFPGSSENQPPLPFESQNVKGITRSEDISFSQNFKLSSSVNIKKSGVSPGKRKRNLDSKTKKRARADSTGNSSDLKQYRITKFFNKKMLVVSEDCKVEVESCNFNDDQSRLPVDDTKLYEEEVNQFIQIVSGGESLRSYATTILEKTKGDINMALDIYYNDKNGTTIDVNDSKRYMESKCPSRVSSGDGDALLSENNKLETKSDIFSPALPKGNLSANYISLPPERYSPTEHACWRKGQPAPYIHIARTFDLVEEEKGKLKATSMLCNMFRSLLVLSPEDVLPTVYLCTNKIAPEHENLELNIGGSIVVAALEEACGTSRAKISNLYNSLGDLGDVAQLCRHTQTLLAPPSALTIQGVFSVLRKIREKEMKFLVRTLVRNLRIGAMMRTILPALAQAIVMNSADEGVAEKLKDHIQRLSGAVVESYNILPNLDLLIPSLMEKGIEFSSSTLSMVPGIPIKPMLAKITNGAPQVLKNFQYRAFTCEFKYDGQRAQIHRLADGSVRVFSRNGDETTLRFPDLVDIIKDCCLHATDTFILDAEVVAIDRRNSKLMSFQELSSRERGSKDSLIALDKIKVDICIFVFDIMFANGEQFLDLPLRQRRQYLKDLFGEEKPGYFEYAREITVESEDADVKIEATLNRMNSFLNDAIHSSCEGIMVKSLDVDAGYTPSKRSDAWLKVKRDYVEGLSDSLDLVPIGAWHGNGRKAGWFSPFLMACYNPDTEDFQSVCRVMSGFSDVFYTEMKEFFSGDRVLSKRPPYYKTSEMPDMWFSPELVWEIRGADFTVSPVHHAAIGLVHPSRGISVRFPRFIRSLSDRKPEECSTAADIADLFSLQTRKMDVNTKR
ncbi:UNVERIFIED_CONTAM: DNA ligase 6 [Sesamum radiatum]|uniref:DNA ligase n=1 Tax=Sesamum radiatum TaxID=300843 RepID=A0AAW2P2D3_SESRA